MYKIKIRLVNGTAPLDLIVFSGERVKYTTIEDLYDWNRIIEEATIFLNTIEGADKTLVHARVSKEDGSMLLDGTFQEGRFSGGVISS